MLRGLDTTQPWELVMPYPQSTQSNPPHVTIWTCETCGFPVSDNAGCLGVPFEDLSDGDHLRWRALHYDCITPEREVYGVPLADLSSARGVARWTCHLMEKSWFNQSTWRGVLGKIAHGSEVPA